MPGTAVAHVLDRPLAPEQITDTANGPPPPRTGYSHSEKATHARTAIAHVLDRPLASRTDHRHREWTTTTSNRLLTLRKGHPCPERPSLMPWTGHWHPEQTTDTRTDRSRFKKATDAANGRSCPGQATGATRTTRAIICLKYPTPALAAYAANR
ncbi:hypothetical protein BU15DRAFT_74923 [Melanogaster broomeanus]|nr:hypothetical protein BU15DRAFT_74923 [Melanogaster broomeanus]